MILQFTLSMPNKGSWNGQWSGESDLYAYTTSFRGKNKIANATKILAEEYFSYNFFDGWSASIAVTEIDASTRRKVDRKTKGCCGYEWMIYSIIENGFITTE